MDIIPSINEQIKTEKNILINGNGNPKNYGIVEQFFYSLLDFYNLNKRLIIWMFKQTFYDLYDSILSQYITIQFTCIKILKNEDLKLLLTIILAFGNHMNSETNKGCAYGFILNILTKLSNIKSIDGSMTFIMYLYQFCNIKYKISKYLV